MHRREPRLALRGRTALITGAAQGIGLALARQLYAQHAYVAPAPTTLRTMNGDDFDRVLSINLVGAFNTVKPALDHVIKRRGHVVLVSSGAAFSPGAGGSPYMISKAAVEQLGRALRLELAGLGTSVQIAYFGIVDTGMTHDLLDADDLGRRINSMLPCAAEPAYHRRAGRHVDC